MRSARRVPPESRGGRARGFTCCFNSSRWIIIAFNGFFTSCATPADNRPSAASFREYRTVDCTSLRYSTLRAISITPTRSPFGSLIACVITRRSLSPKDADSGPRDCRLTSVCSASRRNG